MCCINWLRMIGLGLLIWASFCISLYFLHLSRLAGRFGFRLLGCLIIQCIQGELYPSGNERVSRPTKRIDCRLVDAVPMLSVCSLRLC